MVSSDLTNDNYEECQQSIRLRIEHSDKIDKGTIELLCSFESKIQDANLKDINTKTRVIISGVWVQNHFSHGTVIHLINPCLNKSDKSYMVDNQRGLVVIEPDNLHNCTLVASSLFCERKTWLNNTFLGQVGTNRAMLVGTLVHEVFQYGVKDKILDREKLIKYLDELLDDATVMLEIYSIDLKLDEVRDEAISYIPSVCEWIEKYMLSGPRHPLTNAPDMEVKIVKVRDIEENVWSTKYGLKGKIDVTGVVRIHDRKSKTVSDKTIPLELKTGNPNLSSSHAAQVSLYSMMIEDRYSETNQGFVIYLKNSASMLNVTLTNGIRRDLIQRRNQINHFVKNYFIGPEMLNQNRICQNCERLSECILMSKIYEPGKIEDYSTMKTLEKEAMSHIDSNFIIFFKRYHERLVSLLTQSQIGNNQLNGDNAYNVKKSSSFWTRTSIEAETRGLGFGKLQAFSTGDPKVILFKRHPECSSNIVERIEVVNIEKSTPSKKDDNSSHKSKKIKIFDYFKPVEKIATEAVTNKINSMKLREFNVEANLSRCRLAISLDPEEQTMDSLNSSTAIAIGFMNDLREDQFTMKIYEGSLNTSKSELVYRVDKLEKRSNLDVERTVLIRLLERENCDNIRKLILDPDFKPKENIDLNLHILSEYYNLIDQLNDNHQRFVVGAAATSNYFLLNEDIEKDLTKVDKLVSILIKVLKSLGKSTIVVAQNLDRLVDLMRLLNKCKIQFILVDDGSSAKARYEFASSLVKVPQTENLPLNKKFEIYTRQHELASVVITTYAMSIGGLQFTRKRFNYSISYDCDKTELLLSLSPMFCSDKHIMIDIMDDRDCIMIDESGNEILARDISLGQHLRSLRR